MSFFTINLILALLWASLQSFTPTDLIGGFILGYLILWTLHRWLGPEAYHYTRRMPMFLRFFLYLCKEIVVSTVQVSIMIFRDERTLKPGIIALPLSTRTELELVLFHILVVIIPGTMGVALSPDQKILYIHTIDVSDPDKMRADIKNGLERRLLEVMR